MTETTLEPVDRFHDELKALVAAGIRVNLGIAGSVDQLRAELERIRAALSVRVSLGQSIDEAIRHDASLPGRYRAAALAWVRLDSPSAVLQAVTVTTPVDRTVDRSLRLSLLQMAMILMMACVGLAVYSAWLSPRIDAIYAEIHVTPPTSVRWLSAMHAWLPVWATAAAIGFLLAALFWVRSSKQWTARWARLLPPVRRREELGRSAQFAAHLSNWLQHDLPLNEGIELAAALTLNQTADQRGNPYAMDPRLNEQSTDTFVPVQSLPPLLNWAVAGDVAGEPRWLALQSVSEIYQQLVDRQTAAWVSSMPIIITALVCGLAVLMYGLGLFLPLTALLQDVSAPGSY
jgi:type II secretory pathway component PulF